MRKTIIMVQVILIFVLLGSSVLAMKIPEDVKKAVTFIFVKSGDEYRPVGTGFFVGMKKQGSEDLYIYLVTAKHVLFDENGSLYGSIYIRINKMMEQSEMFALPLRGRTFYHPTDKDADIAVLPIHFSMMQTTFYDFKVIPFEMITTKSIFRDAKIGEGDEMFFTGLFAYYPGIAKNYPIVRFGRVALITDEKIPWKEKRDKPPKKLDLYLAELQSWGGNSGSPVFFYLSPTRDPGTIVIGNPRLLLAGILMGYYQEEDEIQSIEVTVKQVSKQNVGIAAVVPAYKLYELLESEEVRIWRK